MHRCPICGALNPPAASRCAVCSQKLDLADSLFERLATRTPDQLRQIRERGERVKKEEERASQARLALMWAEEDRRRQALAEARANRERQERRILIASLLVVVLAIIVAVVVAASARGNLIRPL